MSGVDLAAIRAWTAANKRARDEYRNHPLAGDPATVCLHPACDLDRAWDKPHCAYHESAMDTAKQRRYRDKRVSR